MKLPNSRKILIWGITVIGGIAMAWIYLGFLFRVAETERQFFDVMALIAVVAINGSWIWIVHWLIDLISDGIEWWKGNPNALNANEIAEDQS